MSHRRRLSLIWLCGLAVAACAGAGVFLYAHRSPGDTRPDPEDPPRPVMDEAQRAYIWEIEHHGLTLGTYGFRPLADALSRADRPALTALLAPGFTATTLNHPRTVRFSSDYAQVVREEDAGAAPTRLDRPRFVDQLLKLRRPFTSPPRVQLALMALRPAEREQMDGPWQGTCLLRMWGEIGKGKPAEVALHLAYRLSQPTKRHLQGGGWLHSVAVTEVQTSRAPHFLMREVAAERGIDVNRFHDNWKKNPRVPTIVSGGVYLCDFDRDGILDMLITDSNGIALYQGQGDGTFRDVTSDVGLPTVWANGSTKQVTAFMDIDGDGWEDLILGGHVYCNTERQPQNGPAGSALPRRWFADYADVCNLRLPVDATGLAVADFDRDGRLDLYVTRPGKSRADSWLSGSSGDRTRGNQLWHNLGHWQFENVTAKSGTAGGNRSTFSAVWLDADNDGWPDLYVINEFGNGVLLINQQDGTFKEHHLAQGPADFGSMGITCGDIDNDGNIDLYIGNMYSKAGQRVIGNVRPDTYADDITAKLHSFVAGSQLWRNRGGLKFEPQGKKLQVNGCGWAYGPALVDLDNDGFLDIFATCGFISHSRTEPDG